MLKSTFEFENREFVVEELVAALRLQKRYRGWVARKTSLNLSKNLHIGYELAVLRLMARA